MNTRLPTSLQITDLHDRLLSALNWPLSDDSTYSEQLWHWIVVNHRNNSLLWIEEDLARRTQVNDSEIARNKRRIDLFNQARNDATECIDELLLLELGLVDEGSARSNKELPAEKLRRTFMRLNSETAGSMVDRLSIVSLKIAAMRIQSLRQDRDGTHREKSSIKLGRLMQQRADLGFCFDELLTDCTAGRAYFKVYRQFKMYNDPQLNPALVAEGAVSTAALSQA